MARWVCRYVTYECLSCLRSWDGSYWQPGNTAAAIANMEGEQGGKIATDNLSKLTCTCPAPHVRIRSRSSSGSSNGVQVRESQRAVVYQYPDGTWAQPGSNDPMDPVAQQCSRDGAVRREFYHTRDMHDFQRAMRKLPTDELSGYNDVVDFDEASRRHRDTNTMDMERLHARESRLRDAFAMLGLSGQSGRYDRAAREYKERGWKIGK